MSSTSWPPTPEWAPQNHAAPDPTDAPPFRAPNPQTFVVEYLPRIIRVNQPAAGAEWTQAVTPGTVWQVNSIAARLVTSAVAANRTARVTLADGSVTYLRAGGSGVQVASTTIDYNWFGSGIPAAANASTICNPFPIYPFVVQGGHSIVSSVSLIDATDQWSQIALYVYEISMEPQSTDILRTERGMDLLRRMRF